MVKGKKVPLLKLKELTDECAMVCPFHHSADGCLAIPPLAPQTHTLTLTLGIYAIKGHLLVYWYYGSAKVQL